MEETEFNARAAAEIEAIAAAFEDGEADVDVEFHGDAVVEIEFESGSKMVINRHGAAREIWVAAPAGGFHFRFDDGCWRDSRDGCELWARLDELSSVAAGKAVKLARPR